MYVRDKRMQAGDARKTGRTLSDAVAMGAMPFVGGLAVGRLVLVLRARAASPSLDAGKPLAFQWPMAAGKATVEQSPVHGTGPSLPGPSAGFLPLLSKPQKIPARFPAGKSVALHRQVR